ncbi:non-hydrolyzing UDP-N-acetylglucosamine 2-epimerase [Youngiibacter fragilis]|uniref:UDP-N-acetylglucosamine 2-epimerase (non-hydrolyzing) n=1 Tax=Youngiibacter fragilis 232.1 TaxID=994573 RepID=V7I991_9CLOT|nr:UDP-N-acetylglucosamine 2-epimerase (non-hydrolyzing) [Youngiibacter fragilis]ETA82403.1 UDP-N-acetylglucosamine 2-epimerase [Youngiibacter fragilis 232.1]
MIRVMSVFGTRPEAIKMAPLLLEMKKRRGFESIVALTGQHRELLKNVLNDFSIGWDFDLDLMQGSQTLSHITTSVLEGMSGIISSVRPDIVLVHGDTTTSFAGALAAFYEKTPVGHVEAGLRTFDKYAPYPEEMNRTLTSRLADLHFAPTDGAEENLLKEGIKVSSIFVTGNTVIDALKTTASSDYRFEDEFLKKVDFSKDIIMVTAHRRENLEHGIHDISMALKVLAEREDVEIVYLVHPNPKIRQEAEKVLKGTARVHLLGALGTRETHNLMARAKIILTDSGGIQEEAPYLGKPVLVLRDVTERPEAVEAGVVRLVGTDTQRIITEASRLLDDQKAYSEMARGGSPYGDGMASGRILDAILTHFGIETSFERFTYKK